MLTDYEIMRRLRMIRYSPRSERQARRAPTLNAIATASQVRSDHLYRLLTGQYRLTDRLRQRLSHALSEKD